MYNFENLKLYIDKIDLEIKYNKEANPKKKAIENLDIN